MREEFQALKASQAVSLGGPASNSSSIAAADPTKGSDGDPVATHSGLEKEASSRKRRREAYSDEEDDLDPDVGESDDDTDGLVELSGAMGAFVEAAFKTKLDNTQRRKKLSKSSTPDSQWVQCPKLNPVVAANVGREATRANRGSSQLHQFLLDAVNPLVATLEMAGAGELTPEAAIANTQTALVLLGNASQHFVAERRKTLLQQLNPKLKNLVEDTDFSEAPPFLFGAGFGKVAKEKLDAAKALKKVSTGGAKQFFEGATPQKVLQAHGAAGSGSRYGSQKFHNFH